MGDEKSRVLNPIPIYQQFDLDLSGRKLVIIQHSYLYIFEAYSINYTEVKICLNNLKQK